MYTVLRLNCCIQALASLSWFPLKFAPLVFTEEYYQYLLGVSKLKLSRPIPGEVSMDPLRDNSSDFGGDGLWCLIHRAH